MKKSPDHYLLCHALCWYNHILSYEKIKVNPSGVKKALGKLLHANVADTQEVELQMIKDKGDIDLFGSEEEVESKRSEETKGRMPCTV